MTALLRGWPVRAPRVSSSAVGSSPPKPKRPPVSRISSGSSFQAIIRDTQPIRRVLTSRAYRRYTGPRGASGSTRRSATRGTLLQPEGLDPVFVLAGVAAVDAVGERLDQAEQRRMRADVGRRVRRVVEPDLRELGDLGERRVGDAHGGGVAMAGQLHRAHDERVRTAGGEADDQRALVDAAQLGERLLR